VRLVRKENNRGYEGALAAVRAEAEKAAKTSRVAASKKAAGKKAVAKEDRGQASEECARPQGRRKKAILAEVTPAAGS